MKIGYLGPEGSFTHTATTCFFSNHLVVPFPSIVSTLKELEEGDLDYVVVPIENSIEGTVNQTLDYLYHQLSIPVQGEIILPIKQHLMVNRKQATSLEKLEVIKSHPQALAQSQTFLANRFKNVPQVMTESTTTAAQWVASHPEERAACVGPKEAAEMYDLVIVHDNIQDIVTNETRFWIVGKNPLRENNWQKSGDRKTIGVSFPENKPGNLHKILSVFSWRGIDLTKIESRPLRTKLGDYYFLIDMKQEQKELSQGALDEIRALGGEIKLLGDYSFFRKTL